jgi:hypothetical protein
LLFSLNCLANSLPAPHAMTHSGDTLNMNLHAKYLRPARHIHLSG